MTISKCNNKIYNNEIFICMKNVLICLKSFIKMPGEFFQQYPFWILYV